MNNYLLGDVEIISVSDGGLVFEASEFFNTVPQEEWDPYPEYSDGRIYMNVGSFILKSSGKTILVDTGLGKLNHHLNQTIKQTLLSDIQKSGISTFDIDMVFMTHLHTDHVGTNMTNSVDGWKPTFENAKYMVHQKDWDLFGARINTEPFEYLKEQVYPLLELGLLNFFSTDINLTDEVSTFETPGHTPGHTSLLIRSRGEMAMILGDALHVPPQVQETHWSPRADRNKTLSTQSRERVVKLLENDNGLIVSGHFPKPGFGRIQINKSKRRIYKPL